jgi:type I restriction enzyme R subunit
MFNEDSRVKIPTLLHLIQLGYKYLSLKGQLWDAETNIFPDIFISSLMRINEGFSADEAQRVLDDISLELDNDDLGKVFYERLMKRQQEIPFSPKVDQWIAPFYIRFFDFR